MGLFLNPEHLKRYKDLVRLFIKYGRSDVVSQAGLDRMISGRERPPTPSSPKVEELPGDLENLGPTYVKLGQFLSTRSDMLPVQVIAALERLQDRAEQFPYEKVEEIVTAEFGVRLSRVFEQFDPVPIAAASLAQVHHAVLRNGREVAVKVQRPGIRERIVKDLSAFEEVAEFLDRHSSTAKRYMILSTLREFRKAMLRELDFLQEAQNLSILGRNLAGFDLIVVPSPVEDYTTSRVLVMDYIHGEKITGISRLRRMELDGSRLAEELFRAYLKQILIDGFYHADPHPGNVFLVNDGRIALLDLGMVARLSEGLQQRLLRLLLAVSEGKSEEAAEYAMEIGEKGADFDERRFSREVSELVVRHQRATIKDIEVGRVVMEVFKIAGASHMVFPSELTMLGKSLLNLDNIGRQLDPAFDPNAAIRRYASQLLRRSIQKSVSPVDLYEVLMDSKEFFQYLPKRVNKIMGALANNDMTLRVNVIDEKYLMTGFQKVANRLTAGLLLASIIIGAALMMPVHTQYRLFGYPAIAIVLFLLAGAGALVLIFLILFKDERITKRE